MWNLEHAVELDIHLISEYPAARQITDRIFDEIAAIKTIRKKTRTKETLKLVILNLWVSHRTDLPIQYSRNKNKYNVHHRYGKLFIKYTPLINTIDALAELGYIHQKIGWLDRTKKLGRESRMWSAAKLIGLFQNIEVGDSKIIVKDRPQEVVMLKNDSKILIDYAERRSIRDMRVNLQRYNEFIGKQLLEVVAPADVMINLKFIRKLELAVLKGVVDFNKFETGCQDGDRNNWAKQRTMDEDEALVLFTTPTNFSNHAVLNQTHAMMESNYQSCPSNSGIIGYVVHASQSHLINHNIQFLASISTMTKSLRKIEDKNVKKYKELLKRPSADFGLNGLDFRWNFPYLHRVFNKGSFKLGGRFFGGFHLELPKGLRRHIRINGEPTLEADYSGLHIRMLYHLEGLDYRADPYVEVCESPEDRNIFKLVLLVAINADTEKEAVQAIRQILRNRKVFDGLTDRSILTRLSRFKTVHPSIAKYLNTGIGRRLQNLDSRITDLILRELTQREVPCLPVHDSYIVPRREREFLLEVMVKAYRDVMNGFEPEIDIKGSSL